MVLLKQNLFVMDNVMCLVENNYTDKWQDEQQGEEKVVYT